MLTQQCYSDRAKRRGISKESTDERAKSKDERDVSAAVDMNINAFLVCGSTAILLPKFSPTALCRWGKLSYTNQSQTAHARERAL